MTRNQARTSKVPKLSYFQRCRAWAKRERGQAWATIAGHYELSEDELLKQLTEHHDADAEKEKLADEKHRADTDRYKYWKRSFSHFPRNSFEIIYADPPWKYDNRGGRGSADKHYSVMNLADICALPVAELAAPQSVLFMWHVATMPAEALEVVNAWGFELVTLKGFTWAKQTSTRNKWHFGMGFYTRANTEDCLIAVRGKKLERADRGVPQLIVEPFTKHSEKPQEARDRIVRLYGDRPRLELFARKAAPGWSAWGDELTNEKEQNK